MSETTEQTTEPENVPENGTTTETEPTEPENETSKDERRDRRYRERLRETEAERDRLREALLPFARAEAERLAAEKHLESGSSLWLTPGLDPADLLDESFAVDPAKVYDAAQRLLDAAPQFARNRAPSYDSGARRESPDHASWNRLLNG